MKNKIVYINNLTTLSFQNAKTIKNIKKGVITGILYLAPGRLSGIDVCEYSSVSCNKYCLYNAGHGAYKNVKKARLERTKLFHQNKTKFWTNVISDINIIIDNGLKYKLSPSIRLNGTSDIRWEYEKVIINDIIVAENIMNLFPNVSFYDYTKWPINLRKQLKNYHLTFSYSEDISFKQVKDYISQGINVAIVFDEVPKEFLGIEVKNGDEDDLIYMNKKGIIIGLKAKGSAIKDTDGFVVRVKDVK